MCAALSTEQCDGRMDGRGAEDETDAKSRNIAVAIRLRPLLKAERQHSSAIAWVAGDPTPRCIRDLRSSQALDFDYVFGTDTSTKQLFEACAADIVHSHCKGYNGAIFAYGQIASGKTFTMYGNGEKPGVIQLSVDKIFNYIACHPDRRFVMELAYLEIYNEQVFDLRASHGTGATNERGEVQVLEDEHGETVFKGLSWLRVCKPEDIDDCLEAGAQRRHVGDTAMSEHTSRSHTILRIKLESMQQECSKTVLSSVLDLVDLAGTEGLRHTEATGERRREGKNINTSLLALSQVIKLLSDKSRSSNGHISFRDSKLTRILRPSIGGNSQTVIVCAVSPAAANYAESKSTLEFASRARAVCNKVQINCFTQEDSGSERIREYMRMISKLRAKLEAQQNVRTKRGENEQTRREIEELESKLEKVQSRVLSAQQLRDTVLMQRGREEGHKLGKRAEPTAERAAVQAGKRSGGSDAQLAEHPSKMCRRTVDAAAGKKHRSESEHKKVVDDEEQIDADAERARALSDEIARLRSAMEQAREEAAQLQLRAQQGRKSRSSPRVALGEDTSTSTLQGRGRSASADESLRSAHSEEDSDEHEDACDAGEEEEELLAEDSHRPTTPQHAECHRKAGGKVAADSRAAATRRDCSQSPRRRRRSHSEAVRMQEESRHSSPVSAVSMAPLALPVASEAASAPERAARPPPGQERAVELITKLLQTLRPGSIPDMSAESLTSNGSLQALLREVQAVVDQVPAQPSEPAVSHARGISPGGLSSSSKQPSPATEFESQKSPLLRQSRSRPPATPLQNHRRKRHRREVADEPSEANRGTHVDEVLELQRELAELKRQNAEMSRRVQLGKQREVEDVADSLQEAAPSDSAAVSEPSPARATLPVESLSDELQELTRNYEELMRQKSQQLKDGQRRDRRAQAAESSTRVAPAQDAASAAATAASRRAEAAEREDAVKRKEKEVMDTRAALLRERDLAAQRIAQRPQHRRSAEVGSDEVARAKAEAQDLQAQLAACRRSREEVFSRNHDDRKLLKKPRKGQKLQRPSDIGGRGRAETGHRASSDSEDAAVPSPRSKTPVADSEQEPDEVLRAWSARRALPIQNLPIQDDGVLQNPAHTHGAAQERCHSPRRRLSASFAQAARPEEAVTVTSAPLARANRAPQASAGSKEIENLGIHIRQQQEKLQRLQKEQADKESRRAAIRTEAVEKQDMEEELRGRLCEQPGKARGSNAPGDQRGSGMGEDDPGRSALEAIIASRNAERVAAESRVAAMKQDVARSRPDLLSVTQADRERQVQNNIGAENDVQRWKNKAKELEMELAAAQRNRNAPPSAPSARHAPEPTAVLGGEGARPALRQPEEKQSAATSPTPASPPAVRPRQHAKGRARGNEEGCNQQ